MPLILIGSVGGIVLGSVLLLMGLLSIAYNKRSAEQYAQNWGRALKNGYNVGRFISIGQSLLRKVLLHIVQQLPRTIWQPQRLHQSLVISESGGDAMMVYIKSAEHVVVARHKCLRVN